MNMNAGLFQQQTLKLSMTQELSQAIALLQYSTLELASFLENKAAENPLISLEMQESNSEYKRKSNKKRQRESDPKYWIEQIGEEKVSLEEYLLSQVHPAVLEKEERYILQHLIRNLDENGYLRITAEELASQLKKSVESVQRVKQLLQSLDPAGVGAYDLKECILLQTNRKVNDPIASTILQDYFELFAEKKWKIISKQLDITLQDIQEVFDFVQTLDPRPCSGFTYEKPSYIVPDVFVEQQQGQLIVKMTNQSWSDVSYNGNYYSHLVALKDKQVNQFLQEKNQEFQWIARGIQQRRETIYKVMIVIADKQPSCLMKGFSYLKPMTMREIADELGIHESTVSRAVKDKFVQAPIGTIEMREFFSSSLQSLDSNDVSAREAKNAIKYLIANEDKKKTISDQQIADALKINNSILLSRRTVAKYRDQLNIPSSSKRKRF